MKRNFWIIFCSFVVGLNVAQGETALTQTNGESTSSGFKKHSKGYNYRKKTRTVPTLSEDELDKIITKRYPVSALPEPVRALIRDLQNTILKKDAVLADKHRIIDEKNRNITEKHQLLLKKDVDILNISRIHLKEIDNLNKEINNLNREIRHSDKVVLNMTMKNSDLEMKHSDLKMKHSDLERKLEREEEMRIRLQAFIDLREMSEQFLSESYPGWAEYRPPNNFDMKYWKNAFLNKENANIIKMTAFLKSHGLSQEDFVNSIGKMRVIRNDLAHGELDMQDRIKAYEYLKNTTLRDSRDRVVLDAVMLYLNIRTYSNGTLESQAMKDITDARKEYKLMRMMYTAGGTNEKTLEKAFGDFAEKSKCAAPISIKFVPSKTYILFDSFETALHYWNEREKIDLTEDERASLRIVHVKKTGSRV